MSCLIIPFLKILMLFLRRFTRHNATSLPGLIVEKFFLRFGLKLASQLELIIFVTGTNGKTTTVKLITHLLDKNNVKYITNPSGANLFRGILSSLISASDLFGHIREKVGVFEVEEGSLPLITFYIKPNVILVTNIFRDQLDAYGEIDKTYSYILTSIRNSAGCSLVINASDPVIARLKSVVNVSNIYELYLEERIKSQIKFEVPSQVDKLLMSIDKNDKNPEVRRNGLSAIKSFSLRNFEQYVDNEGQFFCKFDLVNQENSIKGVSLPLLGIHNALNACYALILASEILGLKVFSGDFENIKPAFGRGEEIQVNLGGAKKSFILLLSKNPAGFELNLNALCALNKVETLLVVLNDKIADGRDVSWIWDIDLSFLKKMSLKNIFFSGTRAYDIALRFKYDCSVFDISSVSTDLEWMLNYLLKNAQGNLVYILCTYTAMLEVRQILSKYSQVNRIWKPN